jgi:hypothetical protein
VDCVRVCVHGLRVGSRGEWKHSASAIMSTDHKTLSAGR